MSIAMTPDDESTRYAKGTKSRPINEIGDPILTSRYSVS